MSSRRSQCWINLTKFLKLISTGTYYQGIYFKNRANYSSTFGGIVSIIAFGLIISYSAYVLEETMNKVNWIVSEDYDFTDPRKFNNFTVAHALDVLDLGILVKN